MFFTLPNISDTPGLGENDITLYRSVSHCTGSEKSEFENISDVSEILDGAGGGAEMRRAEGMQTCRLVDSQI